MFSLDGKTVVVTGGGRGLGRAISRAMARAGANVVIAGRSADTLAETRLELQSIAPRVLAMATDVRKTEDVEQLVKTTIGEFGYIDAWVNNAGSADSGDTGPLLECDSGMWDRVVDLNLKATFFCSQAAARVMTRGGSIIQVSSRSASGPAPNVGWYAAAKAGLNNLTETMAVEWGQFGVRVNAVAPGLILRPDSPDGGARWSPERVAKQMETTPLQRVGDPDDMGGICVFLASDESSWISGQVIGVNGGSAINTSLLAYQRRTEQRSRGAILGG